MSERPRLSFAVPAYNHGAFLAQTLESLLAQSVPAHEIVVSDDHSSDDTQAVLARYAGRIKAVRPPVRNGMAANWNYAVSQTSGDWVSIMGADDMALPNFVADVSAAIAANPDAVLVRGDFDLVDGAGKFLSHERMLSVPRVQLPPATFYHQLGGNKVQPAANAFKRAAWAQVGGFPETLMLYGDWGLWLKLAPLGSFIHTASAIGKYRIDYRQDLAKNRLPQSLADDVAVQFAIIPPIAAHLPSLNRSKIDRPRRRRLRELLAICSELLAANERAFAVDLLRDWAAHDRMSHLLDQFAVGGAITPSRWLVARAALRKLLFR